MNQHQSKIETNIFLKEKVKRVSSIIFRFWKRFFGGYLIDFEVRFVIIYKR